MGAGLYSGEPVGDPAGVPCDPECWSEESKRSVGYELAEKTYRDKAYLCWRCRTPDVFTAVEQKHAFEVRKVYIDQQRVLCRTCHREWVALDLEAYECRRQWAVENASVRGNKEFLQRWLVVLESLSEYNAKRDEANIAMIRRLLEPDSAPNSTRDAGS